MYVLKAQCPPLCEETTSVKGPAPFKSFTPLLSKVNAEVNLLTTDHRLLTTYYLLLTLTTYYLQSKVSAEAEHSK